MIFLWFRRRVEPALQDCCLPRPLDSGEPPELRGYLCLPRSRTIPRKGSMSRLAGKETQLTANTSLRSRERHPIAENELDDRSLRSFLPSVAASLVES